MSDNELLEQIGQGNLEAFEPLWDRYYPQLIGYAQKRMPSDAAEDAVADTMEGVLKAMNNGNGPKKHARGYLFQSLRNTIQAWRKRPEQRHEELDELDLAAAAGPSPESQALVVRVLDGMPAEDAALLRSVLVEGREVSWIAQATGDTPEHISTQLYRAKRRFRTNWVQAHVNLSGAPQPCRAALALVGAVETGTATASQKRAFQKHVQHCPDCPERLSEVRRSAVVLSVTLPAAFGMYALNGAGGVAAGVMPSVATGLEALAAGLFTPLLAFWDVPKLVVAAATTTAVGATTAVGLVMAGAPDPVPAPPAPAITSTTSGQDPQGPTPAASPSAQPADAPATLTPNVPASSAGQEPSAAPTQGPRLPDGGSPAEQGTATSVPGGSSDAGSPTVPGDDTSPAQPPAPQPSAGTSDPESTPDSPGATPAPTSTPETTATPAPTATETAPSTPQPSSWPTERSTCSWSQDLECLPAEGR